VGLADVSGGVPVDQCAVVEEGRGGGRERVGGDGSDQVGAVGFPEDFDQGAGGRIGGIAEDGNLTGGSEGEIGCAQPVGEGGGVTQGVGKDMSEHCLSQQTLIVIGRVGRKLEESQGGYRISARGGVVLQVLGAEEKGGVVRRRIVKTPGWIGELRDELGGDLGSSGVPGGVGIGLVEGEQGTDQTGIILKEGGLLCPAEAPGTIEETFHK